MAWINFAICFFLASFIASTNGIYYDCSFDSLQQCQGIMDGMQDVTDPEQFCSPMRAGRNCLTGLQTSCLDDTTGIKEAVQSSLDAVETYLSLCPEEDNSANMMLFNVANVEETTPSNPGNQESSGDASPEPELYGTCSLYSAQRCNDPVNMLPPYASLTEQCTAWKSALECYQYLKPSCYEQDAIDFVQNGEENMHNNMNGMCDNWSSSTDPDSESSGWSSSPYPDSEPNGWSTTDHPYAEPSGSCSLYSAHRCNDSVGMLPPYASLTEKCTAWKSALECYQHLRPSCYEQDAIDFVRNGEESMRYIINGMCDSWSSSPYPDSEPNVWSSTESPYSEPHGVCNWDTAQGCGEEVNELSVYHSLQQKCSAWQDAWDCYQSLRHDCDDYYLQEYVVGKITEMEDNVNVKCQDVCNWETAYDCGMKVDNLGYYASQSEKCEVWEGALTCFDSIKENCHEHDIYNFVEGKIHEMKNNMDYGMCHGTTTTWHPDAEPHHECNSETARQCVQRLDHMDPDASHTDKCSVWKGALQCFESMEHNCYDADIQRYVYDKTAYIRQNIDGVCLGQCSWEALQYCSESLQSLSGETDLTKICSTYQKAQNCFDSVMYDCDDESIVQSVTQMLGNLESTLRDYCGDVDQDSDKCTWDKIYDCQHDLESAYSAKDKCRAAGGTRQCLYELADDCSAASDMNMREKYRDALDETEQFMNDCMHGNVDGSLTGDHDVAKPSLATSVRSSTTVALLALMMTLVVNAIVQRL